MIALFLVAALLPFGVLSTTVQKCSSGPEALAVRIKGCDEPPCNLVRGEDANLQVDFEVPRDTETVTPLVTAYVVGIPVKYPLPADQAVGCDNLIGAYCPLEAEEEVTYQLLMPVTDVYPKISLDIQLELTDDTGSVIACFKVACKVVDP